MKKLSLLFTLLLALASMTFAQSSVTDKAKGAADSVGQHTADAAQDVGSATKHAATTTGDKLANKTDINNASKDDLMALPGIGEAYSQKIIDGRPYKTKQDLVSRKIIPQATYDKISGKIIAHEMKKK